MRSMGIDFGTGNSVLAEWVGTSSRVFTNLGDSGAVPSDLVIDTTGTFLTDPTLLYRMQIGMVIERAIKRRFINALDTNNGELINRLGQMISARLRYIYDSYAATTDEKVGKAVLTCPANTGQAYRSFLLEIGREIGLPSVDIVDEPTAAAVHHGLSEVAKQNERWMVIDWGCGTCDVSVIQRTKGSSDLNVLQVEGDNELGGMDMDRLLASYLAHRFGFSPDSARPYSIEDIKKRLSKNEAVDTKLALTSGLDIAISCTRKELEELVQPLLARVRGLVDKALAGPHWGSVDRIIATGGPMLMPCVIRLVSDIANDMGAELHASDPLTSVALGAARLAEIKRIGGLVVTNKVAKSIGVRTVDGRGNSDRYHVVIRRGEDRPVTRPLMLTTSIDLQDVIEIEIREGDNEANAEANTLLARLNAVVRPENQGIVKVKLQITLSEAGGMEAYIEPVGDKNMVRKVQAIGIRLEKGQQQIVSGELRTEDPMTEFKAQVLDCFADPDTARQAYERLKIKYHPDRDPANRDHWNRRLSALDIAFTDYLTEIGKRMQASTVPDLPWNKPVELEALVVDEILAHRLTHCLANGIGTEAQRNRMLKLLKRYPDYRRVLASYLFGVKRNPVLQKMLAEDDRPHVGLVVLLQNIPCKPIQERHEVLKAAYRVKESKVRELLNDAALDIDRLYEEVPRVADRPGNPMSGVTAQPARGATPVSSKLKYEYRGADTIVTGKTYPVKDLIKRAGGRWDKPNIAWVIKGKHVTDNEIFG